MLEIIFYAMGIVLGISLLAKLISTITVRRMVKEAAEIQKSNHKLMKLLKAKFEHASLVSDRVQNVGAFVDKYIYEYKVMGIRLNTWRGIPRKMFFVDLILGVFLVCESIRTNGLAESTVGYIQWTSIFILLFALVQFVSGENVRLDAARNYMVEYLENVCIHRYAKRHNAAVEETPDETQADAEPQDKNSKQAETATQETTPIKNSNQTEDAEPATPAENAPKQEPRLQIVEKMNEEEERSQQEMRIRAILEEFLA